MPHAIQKNIIEIMNSACRIVFKDNRLISPVPAKRAQRNANKVKKKIPVYIPI